jgi:hypothetical protein
MLRTARFGLLIRHDDAGREFAYDTGAEKALAKAKGTRLDGGEHAKRLQGGVRPVMAGREYCLFLSLPQSRC